MPDVACIQRPGFVGFTCPLDDCPAVREHRELVGVACLVEPKLEQELVETDRSGTLERGRQLLEVDDTGRSVRDLDRVPSAQGRGLRAVCSIQPFEDPLRAARALAFAAF